MSLGENVVLEVIRNKLQHDIFRLKSYTCKPVDVNGMMGEYFILTCSVDEKGEITSKEKQCRFFVKKRTPYEEVLTKDIIDAVYSKEVETFQMFNAINLPSLNIGVPKCFYCDDLHIILEDLVSENYQNLTPYRVATEEELEVILKTLAGIHAASIAYEEQETAKNLKKWPVRLNKEFPKAFQEIYMNADYQQIIVYIQAVIKGLHTAFTVFELPEILKNGKLLKNEIKRIWDLIDPKIGVKPSTKYRNVICHSDLWGSNIFIKYNEDGKPLHAKLIDLQCAGYMPPALDVLDYILLNTTREYRKTNLLRLKQMYYEFFSTFLKEYGLNPLEIYTWEDFLDSFKEIEMYAIYLGIKTIPMVYNAERSAGDVANSDEFNFILNEDRGQLFSGLGNNSYYKDRVKDCLLDMVEYLENN